VKKSLLAAQVVVTKTDTIIQIREKVKKEYVQNTVFIHDTVTITSYIEKPVEPTVASVTKPTVSDSASGLTSASPQKTKKLYFVISSVPSGEKDKTKIRLLGSKSFSQKDVEPVKQDVIIRFALN
jgi:hypothetical protein